MTDKEIRQEIDKVMNIAYFEGMNNTKSVEFDKMCNEHKDRLVKLFSIPDVRSSLPDDALHFAEWMDIVCIRNGRFEWKYNKDNYTNIHTTKEMYKEWLILTGNDS